MSVHSSNQTIRLPSDVVAENAGVDVSLLKHNLAQTVERRLMEHDAALEVALEFARAGRALHGSAVDGADEL